MGPHMIWSQRKGQKQSARLCGLQQGNPRRNSQEMNEKASYSHWRHIIRIERTHICAQGSPQTLQTLGSQNFSRTYPLLGWKEEKSSSISGVSTGSSTVLCMVLYSILVTTL